MRGWLISMSVFAVTASAAPQAPKLNSQNKKHDFSSQVVEGEVYRPDYSVVTGDAPGEGWGVLRLRANFDDHSNSDDLERTLKESKEKKR